VTEIALLGNDLAAVVLMFFIMAAETAVTFIRLLVTEMAFIGSPANCGLRPDIGLVAIDQIESGLIDIITIFFYGITVTLELQLPESRADLLLGFTPGLVFGCDSDQAILPDPGDVAVDLLAEHPEINDIFRHVINMGRAVMTVDAVHDPPLFRGSLGHCDVTLDKFISAAVWSLDPDLGDLGPLDIGGQILDFDIFGNMPVDTLELAGLGIAATNMESDLVDLWILLVTVAEMLEYLDLLAVELIRPVAMFAGVTSRTKMLDRSRNRFTVTIGDNSGNLAQTRDLGTDEPLGTRTNMAFNTSYFGVGRTLIGSILRGHYLVTYHPAKIR
jgi:hypothetical protein